MSSSKDGTPGMEALDPFVAQFQGARVAAVDAEFTARIHGFVGRDVAAGRAELNIVGGELPTRERAAYQVVSFYTVGNGYDAYAARLVESLERFGVAYRVEAIEAKGTWEGVCALKARFLLETWKRSQVPIVWLDADAVVEQAPGLFGGIDADFGVHRWTWEQGLEDFGYEMCSGTLYFGKTELARRLLEQWAIRCAADPDTWDQVHLESAWCDVSAVSPLRTVWLPREYLQIDGALEIRPAVVRHLRASREQKESRGSAGAVQFLLSPLGMLYRRRNELWRSAEEAFWITQGVDHIIPEVGTPFPEGFDVGAVLHRMLGAESSVLEFGCGVGRIAGLFEAERYFGVDINPNAVAAARRRNPQHTIRLWDKGQVLPSCGALLIYTVLLHISDKELKPLLSAKLGGLLLGQPVVVLAELMDSRWRRGGDPPVFNRDPETYIALMAEEGYEFVSFEKHAYVRYDKEPWNVGRDSRITFLKFAKRKA